MNTKGTREGVQPQQKPVLQKTLERPKRLELNKRHATLMASTLDDMPVITPCRGDKGEEGGRSERLERPQRLEPDRKTSRHTMHARRT